MCKLIAFIYKNTQHHIKSGRYIDEPYTTTTECPHSCGLSSICVSLFVSSLPEALLKGGPKLGNQLVNHIQYCDDLVIIGRTKQELQKQLKRVEKHCKDNDLTINVSKTEAMIFYK